jgi:uncharacterized protein (DUF58 family)
LSVFKGHGIEFAEVRQYIPGDDVRSIDWNVTARLGRPFIKRFAEERHLTLLLACDISGSQRFGTKNRFKSETSAQISALFAFSALKNNDKVGLLLFSDNVELYIPPKKGKRHSLRLIRELLAHKPKGRGTDIGLCLSNINKMLKRRAIVMLISDFNAQKFDKAFKLTAKKHDLIPVVVEDSLERKLPKISALLNVENAEEEKIFDLNLGSSGLHCDFNSFVKAKRRHLKKLFSAAGVDPIYIESESDFVSPIVKFFKVRERKIR